ncbi:patatin-like phospholipase family protein [Bulleidia sp. zg-1006]|uniref:patatin-like phospholipase family protein n=1 Tax=Bulleidia sp. zg-1006 TaxID=2806552 RepID=UPI001939876A|nr:patatin-like phospholipase family protein [Bulleidia sp. zg-1006]QRG86226.1 patatin-like phospholipase family protein [Bulleidia sp. zg-1006]
MRALVLSGGGTKGAFELGAVEALKERDAYHFNLVCGTSVGALNALLLVQNDWDKMKDMYAQLTRDQIVQNFIPDDLKFHTLIEQRKNLSTSIRAYFQQKGLDVSPLKQMIDDYYDEEKFFSSPIDFGIVVARAKDKSGVYVNKEMMKVHGKEWLLASASAYPAFPVCTIDGEDYIDGGYFDNVPIDCALQKGADELFVVDLGEKPLHPECVGVPFITYVHPHLELPHFLEFDVKMLARNRRLGYLETRKALGDYDGYHYTFQHFPTPRFFRSFFVNLLRYERKIEVIHTKDSHIHAGYIQERALAFSLEKQLDEKGLFISFLEEIMVFANLNDEIIYSYEALKNELLIAFKEALIEHISLKKKKGLNPGEAFEALLQTKVSGREWMNEEEALNIYPNEYVLVQFFIEMMKG